MANDNASRGGVGFLTLLGLLFIGLKLTGFVDWAWVVGHVKTDIDGHCTSRHARYSVS